MSREVRRVALDFDWPIGKVWRGYQTPDRLIENECRNCGGTGWSAAGRWLDATFYGDHADVPGWCDTITAAEREHLTAEGRIPSTFGHDAIDRLILIRYRCERLGLEPICADCAGHGSIEKYAGQRAEAEAWVPVEPPSGEGWQFWETVSEGSPLSPVFTTSDALVNWLVNVGAWNKKYSREAAEALCRTGFSLGSFAVVDGSLVDGVEALTRTGGAS